MKKQFFDEMVHIMKDNPNIYFISVGLGWPRTDELQQKFPTRFIQCEASEQTALDIAVGLAYSGKIPVLYTITPFLYRGFETIRTYINHENLNIKLIGAGRDEDYSREDGYSHDAKDIKRILGTQHNIVQYFPENSDELKRNLLFMTLDHRPSFLSLTR